MEMHMREYLARMRRRTPAREQRRRVKILRTAYIGMLATHPQLSGADIPMPKIRAAFFRARVKVKDGVVDFRISTDDRILKKYGSAG